MFHIIRYWLVLDYLLNFSTNDWTISLLKSCYNFYSIQCRRIVYIKIHLNCLKPTVTMEWWRYDGIRFRGNCNESIWITICYLNLILIDSWLKVLMPVINVIHFCLWMLKFTYFKERKNFDNSHFIRKISIKNSSIWKIEFYLYCCSMLKWIKDKSNIPSNTLVNDKLSRTFFAVFTFNLWLWENAVW